MAAAAGVVAVVAVPPAVASHVLAVAVTVVDDVAVAAVSPQPLHFGDPKGRAAGAAPLKLAAEEEMVAPLQVAGVAQQGDDVAVVLPDERAALLLANVCAVELEGAVAASALPTVPTVSLGERRQGQAGGEKKGGSGDLGELCPGLHGFSLLAENLKWPGLGNAPLG